MKLFIATLFLSPEFVQSKPRKLRRPPTQHLAAESRIVGGTQASPGEYPFFVEWNGCGASLIHDDIILSAAHCNPISDNKVVIGAYKSDSLQEGAETRSIVARRSHPAYNDYSVENDFLVMKLNDASTKPPISINKNPSLPIDYEQLTVMGFGTLSEGGMYGSTYLQEVNLEILPHDTCNSQYDGEVVEDVMLCAGVSGGGKDSCQGDSGGPIISMEGVQVGVVSWGNGCGRPEYAGVYSRISGAIDWINEKICELSDNPPDFCPPGGGGGNSGGNSPGNGNGSPGDSNPPANGTVRIRITLVLDDYPEESGVEIVSLRDSDIVIDIPTGSFPDPGMYIEAVDLVPGDYQLKLTDSFGDGLCCEFGEGRFEVHALLPNEELLLVESDGKFTDSVKVEFSVPTPPPIDPPANNDPPAQDPPQNDPPGNNDPPVNDSPEQQDPPVGGGCVDQDESFLIDSVVGDADCDWLGENLIRYNYLCQFLDVAANCRATCEACEYFE